MENNVCFKCANGYMGCVDCCTSPFKEKYPGFWLTLSDVARIMKKTGMKPEEFCRIVEIKEDDNDGGDGDDVDEVYGELLYFGDKVILLNPVNDKCVFLGERGCNIFDVRPMMCRIYPFWFKEEDGKIKVIIQHEDTLKEDDCFLTKSNYKNYDLNHLLSLMNETEENFMQTIKDYIKEMKLHDKHKHELEKKPIADVLKDNGFLG